MCCSFIRVMLIIYHFFAICKPCHWLHFYKNWTTLAPVVNKTQISASDLEDTKAKLLRQKKLRCVAMGAVISEIRLVWQKNIYFGLKYCFLTLSCRARLDLTPLELSQRKMYPLTLRKRREREKKVSLLFFQHRWSRHRRKSWAVI